jgi:hypothetical protein
MLDLESLQVLSPVIERREKPRFNVAADPAITARPSRLISMQTRYLNSWRKQARRSQPCYSRRVVAIW